jgi:DNA invertase Pin-like site-specific DNA recombinase
MATASVNHTRNVYEIVTEKIIKQLESGVAPWRKPWRTEMPVNLISQKAYRGINVFLLGSQGYGSQYWLTFAIVATVAKQERVRISQRVKAGLETARAKGKRLGRPRVAVDARRIAALRSQGHSWRAIASELGASERSVRRCGKYPAASESLTRCLSAVN